MRRPARGALLAAAAVAGLAAVIGGIRRVPAGGAAWNASGGDLLVAGAAQWLPRWRWRAVPGGTVSGEVAAATRGGLRVDVRLTVTFPAGGHHLASAPDPGAALSAAAAAAVRGRIATLDAGCLAGIAAAGCPASPDGEVGAAVAGALALAPERVAVEIEAEPAALAAARRDALRAIAGAAPRRVLVVGWDGADWEVLEPLVKKGAMPALARLMAEGSWGELKSLTPLLSPLIWTTMATGVSPDRHGVLDFVEVDPGSGAKVPVSGRQRRVPAIWNEASAAGRTVSVAGWWASWPAEPVNGVLVSDRLFFLLGDSGGEPAGTLVHPAEREPAFRELAARAERETGEAEVRALLPVGAEAYRAAIAAHRGMADPIDGFRRILVGTRTYFGAALLAAEQAAAPADLTMVYAIGTDEVGHLLSPYLPPPLPGADPAFSAAAALGVARYYSVVDRWLGRLLATCPERDCAVLVVSDHGFKWGSDRPREFSGTAAATAALWHRPNGIFVIAGKDVARLGRAAAAPSVYDVAPTIAALAGIPPGKDWPGQPLPGCPAALPAVDWAALVPPESYRPAAAPAQPSEEYVKQLRSLGYLETGEGAGRGRDATEGELNNLGLVHLEAKRYPEAEKAFHDAVSRNPAYASPHYNLRRTYFETGRYDDADAELWRAVELKLRDAAGAVDRAALDYEAANLADRSLGLLAEARRRFPEQARFAVHRVALLVKLGRCGEALDDGRAAAGAFAADARVHAFCGLAAACAGERDEARRELERSLQLDPHQPELRAALAGLADAR